MSSNDEKRRAEQTSRERINSNKVVLLSERVEVDLGPPILNDLGGHLYTGADQVLCITDRGGGGGEVCAVDGTGGYPRSGCFGRALTLAGCTSGRWC